MDDLVLREEQIIEEGKKLVSQGRALELKTLIRSSEDFFNLIPRARMAKIVRTLIDLLDADESARKVQIELCKDCVEWCNKENRSFLRMRMETKLASLYLAERQFSDGLALLTKLISEVKKLDNKLLLVEIFLLEASIQFEIENLPKAKASLTAARTNANAINCPPLLQAALDMKNGEINSAEADYKTAYSYFYEAFEAFHLHEAGSARALRALQLMMLSKAMANQAAEVAALANGKYGQRYAGRHVEAMRAIAKSQSARSLRQFEETLQTFKKELTEDPVIKKHTTEMHEILLEQNILRVLEPYKRVEIAYIAETLELPLGQVELKLASMILDEKLKGTLTQSLGILELFKEAEISPLYGDSLKTLQDLGKAVSTLQEKAKLITI